MAQQVDSGLAIGPESVPEQGGSDALPFLAGKLFVGAVQPEPDKAQRQVRGGPLVHRPLGYPQRVIEKMQAYGVPDVVVQSPAAAQHEVVPFGEPRCHAGDLARIDVPHRGEQVGVEAVAMQQARPYSNGTSAWSGAQVSA